MTEQSPYSAPKSSLINTSDTPEEVYGFKKIVIQNEEDGGKWPFRCYKCNDKTEHKRELKLYHVNPWVYLTILVSPIILIIVSLIVRKKFTVSLPICENHIKKRKRFIISQWAVFILTLILLAVGAVYGLEIMIIISCVLFLYLVIAAIASRMVFIAKRKKNQLWIRGANKTFVNSLPEYDQ